MGTQGDYGGSSGWKPVRDAIEDWVSQPDAGPGDAGAAGGGDVEAAPVENALPDHQGEEQPPPEAAPSPARRHTAPLASLRELGQRLSDAGRGGGARGGTAAGRSGGGRSIRRAASSGGAAAAAWYGARARDPRAFEGTGLVLGDLEGLSPMRQAYRIVESASPRGAGLQDDEIRSANAAFAALCTEQEGTLDPVWIVRAWVTEYVWKVWIREVGALIRGDGGLAREKEMRATLEARMQLVAFDPVGVNASAFAAAIRRALASLRSVFGSDAP